MIKKKTYETRVRVIRQRDNFSESGIKIRFLWEVESNIGPFWVDNIPPWIDRKADAKKHILGRVQQFGFTHVKIHWKNETW